MIAKRIVRPKGTSEFARLARYVVGGKAGVDPASWARLGSYVLDAAHGGEKVAWTRVTNCVSEHAGWAVKEIEATQARNTRSKADKSYHLVLSFPEGERPTRGQLEDIEDRVCQAIGLGEHQRISAVHQDTDHWHVHVAINKVHPVSFRNVEPYYDHYRLQEVCEELEIRHGLIRTNHTPGPERGPRGRAADVEAFQGRDSFLRWVRAEAAPVLLEAVRGGGGWPALHRAAAQFDLVIKTRGAGLAIGHRSDAKLYVKASEVDRGLSLKALQAMLGAYEASDERAQAETPRTAYRSRNVPGSGEAQALHAAYLAQRAAAVTAREAALAALRQRQQDYARRLRAWYDGQYRKVREQRLPSPLRRRTCENLARQRRLDQAERIAWEAEERQRLREAHAIPPWQAHLETLAGGGDVAALKILRERRQRQHAVEVALLSAADAEAARDVIYAHLKPVVRRDGRLIYRVDDGGVVVDEARHVRVSQVTAGSAYLALSLAADRFGDRALVVNGTDDFGRQLATLAAMKSLPVTFADPTLEQQRLVAVRRRRDDQGRDGAERGR